ncbi:MAG: hypothetical protein FWG99_11790 [Treponema sp.]|nr:hypothetical protein [Treponema sp.]
MVNKKMFWLGILAMMLVFGMTVVGCGDGTTNGNGLTAEQKEFKQDFLTEYNDLDAAGKAEWAAEFTGAGLPANPNNWSDSDWKKFFALIKDDEGDVNVNGNGGIFTLNLIPSQYNGKYVFLMNYYESSHTTGTPCLCDYIPRLDECICEPDCGECSFSPGFSEEDEDIGFLMGAQSINSSNHTMKGVVISNRIANIPLWFTAEENFIFLRYSGNDTFKIDVIISDDETIDFEQFFDFDFSFIIGNDLGPVIFSNGNAAKSWNEGETWDLDDLDHSDE